MRHPLLIGRVEKIVENDFEIGHGYKSIIITGSNTGGKTVALKTIGLLSLMGLQLIAKSFGAKSFKMKFGHRGANQPVKDLKTGKVFITSQNHGFCIDADSLKNSDLELTQINLNDGTPEGFKHKELPLRTIQYHPEAGPGPNDTKFLFKEFTDLVKDY